MSQVYGDLTRYEEALGRLVESVDQFRPDLSCARELIEADRALGKSLDKFGQYDEVDKELQRLDRESERLNRHTARTLETLDECYRALSALPMLEQVKFEQRKVLEQRGRVNSAVLLEYATKLSKFTKAPAGVAVGPNNFVWPAEDALRRGQLAVAALHSEEITLGSTGERSGSVEPSESVQPTESAEPRKYEPHRVEPAKEEASESPVDLDLDLFDPDEF